MLGPAPLAAVTRYFWNFLYLAQRRTAAARRGLRVGQVNPATMAPI
jgi:hypothetical protein